MRPSFKFTVLYLVFPVLKSAEQLFNFLPVWLLKRFLIRSTTAIASRLYHRHQSDGPSRASATPILCRADARRLWRHAGSILSSSTILNHQSAKVRGSTLKDAAVDLVERPVRVLAHQGQAVDPPR